MIKGIDFVGITLGCFVYHPEYGILCSMRSDQCRDERNTWDFIGGGLKINESMEEGIKRELKEEVNVIPTFLHFLGHREIFREHEGNKTHWISFKYLTIIDSIDEVKNMEPHKHTEIKFFPLDNLPNIDKTHSQFYPALATHKDMIESIIGKKMYLPHA